MSKNCKKSIAFLVLMLMALIYAPMASAADGLTVDSQQCTAAGGEVVFTISVTNAPTSVGSFGLKINYDGNVLEYVKFEKGTLVSAFTFCDLSPAGANTLTFGGMDLGAGIAKGANGTMATLTFNVKSCEPAAITLTDLVDEMAGWPAQAGGLTAPILHNPVLQAIGDQSIWLGDSISFTAIATDEDGEAITYSSPDLPSGAYLGSQSGEFDWTPNPGQAGSYAVTITAMDSTGRTDSKTFQITVQEPHAPVLQAIGPQTVTAEGTLNLTAHADDMDGDAIIYSATSLPDGSSFDPSTATLVWIPTLAQVGMYSATITATDSTGRSDSETFTIAVVLANMNIDSQSCVGAGEEVTFTISVDSAPAAASAFGFEISYDENILEYKSFAKGDLTQGFMLLDVSKPSSKPNTLRAGAVGGSQKIELGNSGSILKLVFTVKSCEISDLSLVNMIDDVFGWSTMGGQLVFAPDTDPPVITCPGNITVMADDANGTPSSNAAIQTFLDSAVATDLNDGPVTVINNAPAQFSIGTTAVAFSATDKAGNTSDCTAIVEVGDTVAPIITCPASISVEAEGANGTSTSNANIQAFLNSASAVDNIDGSVSVINNAPAVCGLGDTIITFDAMDSAGNKATCSATVSVVDTIIPVITCPADVTVAAEGANGVSSSNSAVQAFLNAVQAIDTVGVVDIINDAPAVIALGAQNVTFTATDAAGNTSSCTATLTVADLKAPDISCPGNITIEAEGPNGVPGDRAAILAFINAAVAIDAVDGVVNVNATAPAMFGLGDTVVTFTAADSAGNPATCTAIVSVVDKTAPDITCPGDITVEAEGPNGVPGNSAAIQALLNGATAVDAIDGTVSITNDAPASFGLGATSVTFTAMDSAGNSATCTATVNVVDTTRPDINCPAGITVEAVGPNGVSSSDAAIQAFLNNATASDIVDVSVSVTNNAPAQFGIGNTEVFFAATDTAFNTNSCSAIVSVVDTQGPAIICPVGITVEAEGPSGVSVNNSEVQAFLNSATANDAVSGLASVTNNAPDLFGLGGDTDVTFSAVDSTGNPSTCIATVSVVDLTAPTINCPANITVETYSADGVLASDAKIQAFLKGATANDTVSGSVDVTNNAPAKFGLGDTVVSFSCMDASGNPASCVATITVKQIASSTGFLGGNLGGDLWGAAHWSGSPWSSYTSYQSSGDLFSNFNQQLYNFQLQSWNLNQQPTTFNWNWSNNQPVWNNVLQPLWSYQQPIWPLY
ncbi:MAG: HYR domain-containing protein [bacterium]